MRISRKLVTVFACFSLTHVLSADTSHFNRELYFRAYDVLLETGDVDAFHELLDQFEASVSMLDRDEALVWAGRAAHLRGISEVSLGDRESGEAYLEDALRGAFEIREKSPEESYLLEAESRVELMQLKGFVYRIRHAAGVQKLVKKAIALDPLNPRAHLLAAVGLINAPRLFGGDIERGITILEAALDGNSVELTRQMRFQYLYALGRAYAKTGDTGNARDTIAAALRLYPGNRDAMDNLRAFDTTR